MIRLGLRLAGRGGRGALARLALMAVAIGVGVALVLVLVGGVVGASRRSARVNDRDFPDAGGGEVGLLWSPQELRVPGSAPVTNIAVAPLDADAPVPPGTGGVPAPGTVLVSPELRRRIAAGAVAAPSGRVVGTLGREMLGRPDDLVTMTGWRADELRAADPDAQRVVWFRERDDVTDGVFGKSPDVRGILLGVPFVLLGVSIFLLPVLVLVGAGARVGARRRERRLAALRLAGATPHEMRVLTAVEAAVAGVAGSVLGLLAALVVRQVAIGRAAYFAADLTLPVLWVGLAVAMGPVLAAASAALAMGRVGAAPLGPAREVPDRVSPRVWWFLAVAWVVFVVGIVGTRQTWRIDGAVAGWTVAIGFLGILVGLMACGPELVQRLAGGLARRSRGPAALLAGRRLQAQPRLGFRAVLAVLLSLFVTTLLLVFLPSVDAEDAGPDRSSSELRPDLQASAGGASGFQSVGDESTLPSTGQSVELAEETAELAGVERVLPVVAARATFGGAEGVPFGSPDSYGVMVGIIAADCLDFSAVTRTSPSGCRPGTLVAPAYAGTIADGVSSVIFPLVGRRGIELAPAPADLQPLATLAGASYPVVALTPPSLLPPEVLESGRLEGMYIDTDGSPETARRVAALLATRAPGMDLAPGAAQSSIVVVDTADTGAWLLPLLAYVLVLAACALAVVTVDGIFERRRGLAALRAAGAGAGVLRRATMLEIAWPLLAVAALGALNGAATGIAFAVSRDVPVRPEWTGLALSAGLLVGLWIAVSAIALPAVTRASSLRELRTI